MRHLSFLALASAVALGSTACKSKTPPSGTASPERATAEAPVKESAKPSVRPTLRTLRPLLPEAARAEVDMDGLLIDMGTADQQKYTRGGWGTGWGENGTADGVTFARATGSNPALDLQLMGPSNKVVVRGRSAVPGQKITLYFDGKAIKSEDLGSEWGEVSFALPATAEPGRHGIRFVFKAAGESRADIDWVHVARPEVTKSPLAVPRVMPLKVGRAPRRALVAPSARTYAFYLQPLTGSRLVFDFASNVDTTFVVRASTDGAETQELFRQKATGDWQEANVDLTGLAGKVVRLELTTEGGEGLTGWGEPEIMLPPDAMPAPVATEGAAPRNLVFLLIDTQRADAFKTFNDKSDFQTPHFDALAARSLAFNAAYNNENWTKPSVATSLTGVYPVTHDTKSDGAALPEALEMVSQKLKADGFKTAGFVANGYVSDKFGFDKGWDLFRNYIREGRRTEAENVFKDALEWIEKVGPEDRFFTYIQTIDPHVPYRSDEVYTKMFFEGAYKGKLGPSIEAEEQIALSKTPEKFTDEDRKWVRAQYQAEVSYHDAMLGNFIKALEEKGRLADTIFVVTNDHGEEIGDHGRWGHGHSLYEELLRAPLVVHYDPLFKPGQTFGEVVEHVDLMPTMVDALGLAPMKGADGVSLMPALKGEPTQWPLYSLSEFQTAKRALRVGTWKLVRSTGSGKELYDIQNDPGETKDLSGSHPLALRYCEVHMGEGMASPQKRQRLEDAATRQRFTAGRAQIDPEMRRQLEALGYFGE